MKLWWKQLWCLHYWIETGLTDPYKHPFKEAYENECNRCGKKKFFLNEPINFIG